MGVGSGFGKVILLNEHFVVYGIPAIASAIDSRTEALVERVEDPRLLVPSGREGSMAGVGWVLEDDRPANPGYKAEKREHQKESVERVLRAAEFDASKSHIRITLGGDLKAVGGVGASAAVCVSLARALNDEFDLGFDDARVNQIAYEGEKAYAGTPSGIDNTASTYGGLLRFERDLAGGETRIDRWKVRRPIAIVMGNTGITANTKAAVEGVRERRERIPDRYGKIFEDSRRLIEDAHGALVAYDLKTLGKLMDRNHLLLQQIEVSHPRLDELVGIARDQGAWGAKMTGGGLGGYMVALTPEMDVQERVAEAMEQAGYEALRTTIGV
jgi:mevalonate kinase